METTFIYFLKDPENPIKGYVGKSNNPKARLRDHLKDSRRKVYRSNWVESLVKRGLKPTLEILDEVPAEFWPQWEVAYIEYFREQGYALVNVTPGGDCGPILFGEAHPMFGKTGEQHPMFGKKHKPNTLAKMSAARKGAKQSPEWIENARVTRIGKKKSTACLIKMRVKKGGSSKFHGVFWRTDRKTWTSQICADFKTIRLGCFSNEIEAAKAYDAAARLHHGEYAKLNFP